MWVGSRCGFFFRVEKERFYSSFVQWNSELFKYGVSVDNLFYFGCRSTRCWRTLFPKLCKEPEEKKRKNMQPGIVAAGERILSFISSFHCFFRQKKIFFLKKAAINTYIKNKKIKKTWQRIRIPASCCHSWEEGIWMYIRDLKRERNDQLDA